MTYNILNHRDEMDENECQRAEQEDIPRNLKQANPKLEWKISLQIE